MDNTSSDESSRLLGFWRALEVFSPQPWPALEPLHDGSGRLASDDPVPWRVHRLAVYAGRVSLPDGTVTYLLSGVVLDDGVMVDGSVRLSPLMRARTTSDTPLSWDPSAGVTISSLTALTTATFEKTEHDDCTLDATVVKVLDLGPTQPEMASAVPDLAALWRREHTQATNHDEKTPLPWPRRAKFRFVIHLGIEQGPAYDLIQRRTERASSGEVDHLRERRPSGRATLLSFTVTDDSRALAGSLKISEHAQAIARSITPGPHDPRWLDVSLLTDTLTRLNENFDLDVAGVTGEQLRDLRREQGTSLGVLGPKRVTKQSLWDFVRHAGTVLGLSMEEGLVTTHLRCVCQRIKDDARTVDDGQLLDSFYLDSLSRAGAALEDDGLGSALNEYLAVPSTNARNSRARTSDDPRLALAASAPDRVPTGRWPEKASHSLSLGQQIAVNNILASVESETPQPLVGVNGPPGTGKTTLLKDVIAGLVVKRAEALAELTKPWDALPGLNPKTMTWAPVDQSIAGFEILVASSNNAAVENITAEIPDREALGEQWRESLSSTTVDSEFEAAFADVASHLMGSKNDGPKEAWALVAAALGRAGNRQEFVEAFWFSRDHPTIRSILRDATEVSSEERRRRWDTCVRAFREAQAEEQVLRDERVRAHGSLAELALSLERASEAGATCDRIAARLPLLRQHIVQAERSHNHLQGLARAAEETVRQCEAGRPSLLTALRTRWQARRLWHDDLIRLRVNLAEATATTQAAFGRTKQALLDELSQFAELDASRSRHAEAVHHLALARDAVRRSREPLGEHFPDPSWWFTDRDRREKSSPWSDEAWNVARTEVFLAAMRLHRQLLLSAPHHFRKNLALSVDIIKGGAGRSHASDEQVLAAWQTLFLVVPVISTTFASAERQLSGLGRDSVGWLVVDEAGQATPQAAVGALARSSRMIAVGDPMQLEPIDTIPPRTRSLLAQHFSVPERWIPPQVSVQRAVDIHTPWGTSRGESNEDHDWVGLPLTVHRRCEDPMFGISNALAYDGRMVHATEATTQNFSTGRFAAAEWWESSWIDVPSRDESTRCQRDEIAILDRLLRELRTGGIPPTDIRILAAFRDVSTAVRSTGTRHGLPQKNSGTVHTAQGQQAPIVILVLGSAAQAAGQGSRSWVNSAPNLINVAVSRAKQRLYVIGDHDAWSSMPVTGYVAQSLTRVSPEVFFDPATLEGTSSPIGAASVDDHSM